MKYFVFILTIVLVHSCADKPVKQQVAQQPVIVAKEPRKLRYVLKPNHCGIMGFFNDGSVAGSVSPEISKHNIATLDTAEVYAHYTIDKHYIIFDDDHNSLDFSSDVEGGYKWIMVDYNWKMSLPE